jgi:hypothetical protein
MSCQSLGDLLPGDIARAHALLGPSAELIEHRRAVYLTAIELLTGDSPPVVEHGVLDNPMVRGHLGEVLTGAVRYDRDFLRPVTALTTESSSFMVSGFPVRVAAAARAQFDLTGALRRIGVELDRHGTGGQAPGVITADRPIFGVAYDRLRHGVELAAEVAPELVQDLLPHVTLIAVLDDTSGRVGSASVREYPGLVMVPSPASSLEASEALIHEGAHQRFFDLAITRAMFGANQHAAPKFVSSWAAPNAPHWPIEQTFAAFHAYCCLGAFAENLPTMRRVAAQSLLPVAAKRAAEIGDWLLRHGEFLGTDGHALIEGLLGRRPGHPPAAELVPAIREITRDEAIVHRLGRRTLIGRRTSPVELFWVSHNLTDDDR